MAAADADMDGDCIRCFQKFVGKEHAGSSKLSEAEKKFGKGTTVRKIIKECLGEGNELVSTCEASIYPKYQDKQTKKVSAEDFVQKVLPELAAVKAKKGGDAKKILITWKRKMVTNVGETEKATKNAAVVDRLTDTSKYTGSHKERFDAEGKGKGAEGREDRADNKGYVGGYKGEGTFGQKK